MANAFPHGIVHEAREDLQAALRSDPEVFALWENLTPLGRNEFICWMDDAKQPRIRQRRIERTCDELLGARNVPAAGRLHSSYRQGTEPMATGGLDRSAGEEKAVSRFECKGAGEDAGTRRVPIYDN